MGTVLPNGKKQTVILPCHNSTAHLLQVNTVTSLPLDSADRMTLLTLWSGATAHPLSSSPRQKMHLTARYQREQRSAPSRPRVESKLWRRIKQNILLAGLHWGVAGLHHRTRSSSVHQKKSRSPTSCPQVLPWTSYGHLSPAGVQWFCQWDLSLQQRFRCRAAAQIWHSLCPSARPAASRHTASLKDKPSSERTLREGGALPGCPDKDHSSPVGLFLKGLQTCHTSSSESD